MLSYIWPLALVVLSNTLYQICAKSMPEDVNPLASLTITYTVSAAASFVMFLLMNKNPSITEEYGKINWVSFVFGIVLVGLELGWIYIYKAGWTVSTASVTQSAVLAVALILVGGLLFHEKIGWNKIVGTVICLIGLIFINYK